MPKGSFIVVTGDSGTKGLDLEGQVQKCVKDKDAHLFIVNVPTYDPVYGDPESLAAYQRLALKVVDIKDAGVGGRDGRGSGGKSRFEKDKRRR